MKLGYLDLIPISWTDSRIIFSLPSGSGANVLLKVTTSLNPSDSTRYTASSFFSYKVPTITSIIPNRASAGTTITIQGSNFGPFGASVTIGGRTCTMISQIHHQILCILPIWQGLQQDTIIRVVSNMTVPSTSQESLIFSYDYAGPIIRTMDPHNGPTIGGTRITLTGENFGTGVIASVLFNQIQCPQSLQCQVISWNNTQIVFTTPAGPGQGVTADVGVSSGGQVADLTTTFFYDPPNISDVYPQQGPTSGGISITIDGISLGRSGDATVKIGEVDCPITSTVPHTRLICTLPAGVGIQQTVVRVLTQASRPFSYRYQAPILTSVSPLSGPTSGKIIITLLGSNFGTQGDRSVTIGGQICDWNGLVWSQNHIECLLPSGQGLNNIIAVFISGLSINQNFTFNYNPPNLTAIIPANGPTSGGVSILLLGLNFGLSGTVRIGGKPCIVQAPATDYSHNQIICLLPEGRGIGVPVSINISNQDVQSNAPTFSYDLPRITSLSPATGPTIGSTLVLISGTSFDTSGTVLIGNNNATIVSWGHSQIQIRTPPGAGINLPVRITTIVGLVANATFSYLPPTLDNISPTESVTAGGGVLTLQGSNLGPSGTGQVQIGSDTIGWTNCTLISQGHNAMQCIIPPGQGSVRFVRAIVGEQMSNLLPFSYTAPVLSTVTPARGPTLGNTLLNITGQSLGSSGATVTIDFRNCLVVNQTHTWITCLSPPGQGKSLIIRVTLPPNIESSNSNLNLVTFDYFPPNVTSIFPRDNLPTSGGINITLQGNNFGLRQFDTPLFRIAGQSCQISFSNHTIIICSIPPGEGQNIPVQVTVGGQDQVNIPWTVSYAGPILTQLSPTNGPTTGRILLNITGTNFGPSSVVTIGGLLCDSVSIANLSITCLVPVGVGVNLSTIVSSGGQVSNSLNFSYNRPNLLRISPNNGPTAGELLLHLMGLILVLVEFVLF